MFGYILPEKPEMKIREYELFRAYYCGVCKSMGDRYGQISRLTLNYDSAFLAILLGAVAGEKVTTVMERCIAHPGKKKNIIRNSEIIDYASDINIVLAYYNLEDDWEDERSVLSGTAAVLLRSAFKKIKKKNPEICAIIEGRLAELHKLEKEGCKSMDMAAEPFAKLMQSVLLYKPLCGIPGNTDILGWIGYNVGKWIYILDAYDDLGKDIRKKAYNPLVCQYGYNGDELCGFRNRIREKVEFNLTYSLNQIAKAFELLDIKNNSGILENIIYMGMLRKTESILETGSCKKIEQSV
jgi:hypothetical protein